MEALGFLLRAVLAEGIACLVAKDTLDLAGIAWGIDERKGLCSL